MAGPLCPGQIPAQARIGGFLQSAGSTRVHSACFCQHHYLAGTISPGWHQYPLGWGVRVPSGESGAFMGRSQLLNLCSRMSVSVSHGECQQGQKRNLELHGSLMLLGPGTVCLPLKV